LTVVLAIKAANKVVIASDSLTTLDDRKLKNVINDPKLFKFTNFIVGIAGTGPIGDVLEEIRATDYSEEDYNWVDHEIHNKGDVTIFFESFLQKFKEKFSDYSGDEDEKPEFLIITKSKIFLVLGESSVFEIKNFWSIGSGGDLALGALSALYEDIKTQKKLYEVAKTAVDISCKYSKTCEGPFYIESLNE
jgi:ATP-dependent protease HslVU (ClpYQ) peptidase subunit